MKPRNIVFILTDQQHFRSLQANGCAEARTPNLDRLASEGLNFLNHNVTNPVCSPSRGSIWTGRMPSETGLYANGAPFAMPRPRTVMEDLNATGYVTAHAGKMHLEPIINRTQPHPAFGFQEFQCGEGDQWYLHDDYNNWLRCNHPREFIRHYSKLFRENWNAPHTSDIPEELTHSAWVTRKGMEFLDRQRDSDAPFFLSLGYFDPHHAFNPCEPYASQWADADVSAPHTNPEQWRTMPACMQNDFQKDLWQDHPEYMKQVLRAYHAMINHIDDCIGRLLATLEKNGQLENTVIVFSSDHGDFAGNHGRLFKGGCLMDDLLRVPLMVWSGDPALRVNGTVQEVTSALDFYPTFLRLAGSDAEAPAGTRAFLDANLGVHPDGPRGYALSEWRNPPFESPQGDIVSLRTREHRLTLYPNAGEEEGELYCHQEDPYELHNRYGDTALLDTREKLRKLLTEAAPGRSNWPEPQTFW